MVCKVLSFFFLCWWCVDSEKTQKRNKKNSETKTIPYMCWCRRNYHQLAAVRNVAYLVHGLKLPVSLNRSRPTAKNCPNQKHNGSCLFC